MPYPDPIRTSVGLLKIEDRTETVFPDWPKGSAIKIHFRMKLTLIRPTGPPEAPWVAGD